jgi:S-formylglutathione hydrolase FrmB
MQIKKSILLLLFTALIVFSQAQAQKGRVQVERINAPSLKNTGGENPQRRVSIYLPPGYDNSTQRYPVIYFLHGFAWSDSMLVASDHFDLLLDKAISAGKIRPVIMVMPDEYTLYKGSFYTNSTLTGNWADFTAIDLVKFIDKKFRTIPDRKSRGIAGHSMGGHGALKIAMMFPEVFSSVYALSPGVLGLEGIVEPGNLSFKRIQQLKSMEELLSGWNEVSANLLVALGRAYSPNPAHPPFFTDLPFTFSGDSVIINTQVLELWKRNSPLNMIDTYEMNLHKLKAIKFDWGRNDEFTFIPSGCELFSRKLESLGINHYAEEYIGTHGSKICSDDGRLINELLPFFDANLVFEE